MENFIIKENKIRYLDYLFVKNVPLMTSRKFILLIPIEITGEIPEDIISSVSQKNFYLSISATDYNFLDRKRWTKRNFLNRFYNKKERGDIIYLNLISKEIGLGSFEGWKILLDEIDSISEKECKGLLLDLYYSSNARIVAGSSYADLIDYLIQ